MSAASWAVRCASSATRWPASVSVTSARRASRGFDSRPTSPMRSSGATWRAIPDVVTPSLFASLTRRSFSSGAARSSRSSARSESEMPWWYPSGWSTARSTSVRASARSSTVLSGRLRRSMASSPYHQPVNDRSFLAERSHDDRAVPRHGMELRDLDGLRHRRAVDDVEAADHFLRLGERPVGHEWLAAADRDPLRYPGRLEPAADQPRAALLDLREPLQHLLWLDAELGVLLGLDQEQELHR